MKTITFTELQTLQKKLQKQHEENRYTEHKIKTKLNKAIALYEAVPHLAQAMRKRDFSWFLAPVMYLAKNLEGTANFTNYYTTTYVYSCYLNKYILINFRSELEKEAKKLVNLIKESKFELSKQLLLFLQPESHDTGFYNKAYKLLYSEKIEKLVLEKLALDTKEFKKKLITAKKPKKVNHSLARFIRVYADLVNDKILNNPNQLYEEYVQDKSRNTFYLGVIAAKHFKCTFLNFLENQIQKKAKQYGIKTVIFKH